ncbi:macrophage mannose receptor 1 [Drosophila innubila]|uniref:macrophage mannose receptor 1 n=1 Tax=Drosophila innubila TaxID=198719 RepID=UPI00148BCA7B|nr:macrophage mannose receptor 1 [Drosophila innubila]
MLFRHLLLSCSLLLWNCQESVSSASNEKYYAATFAKVNWFQAQSACQRSNMMLASVTSLQRHLQVIRSISLNGHLLGHEKFWLGGNNLGDLSTWNWMSRGLPFGYKKWAKDEPRSALTGQEGCLAMGLDEDWHSEDCNNEYYFVCERQCNSSATFEPLYI